MNSIFDNIVNALILIMLLLIGIAFTGLYVKTSEGNTLSIKCEFVAPAKSNI